MVHPANTTDMAELAAQKYRRSTGLDDDPLGRLRSPIRRVRYSAEFQHTGAAAAAMLHHFDDRDLVPDTGVRKEMVSTESDNRGGWIGYFAGRG